MSTTLTAWNPVSRLRLRMQRWWFERLAPKDRVELRQRNIYILPTAAGWLLLLVLLAMLVASINYQLNLGYLLTFVLAGNVASSIHLCHGTMRGLSLWWMPGPRVFAGQGQSLRITLDNPKARNRYAIALSVWDGAAQASMADPIVDIPSRAQSTLELLVPTQRRGWLSLPLLKAQTTYPMGLFRVWTLWRPASQVLVYPQPEKNPPPWPLHWSTNADTGTGQARTSGEIDGVRPYRAGDSLRLLVWPRVARSEMPQHWVSRDTAQAWQAPVWLDWQAITGLDTEARISRLAAWVLKADRAGIVYGLRLRDRQIAASSGPMHRDACLEALALC